MANVVVVGAQWGDEGKGKIVDWLSERADVVVRFQGGHNAGHTLVIDKITYKLSLLPSGVVRPGKLAVIGNGVVVDPWALIARDRDRPRRRASRSRRDNLRIAENATLILPLHRELDVIRENAAGAGKIGTTGRGIGPAYEDKVGRRAHSVADLRDLDDASAPRSTGCSSTTMRCAAVWAWPRSAAACSMPELDRDRAADPRIRRHGVGDLLDGQRRAGKRILFEGAQGALLDIDHGTYPFVTSSNTVAAQAATGSGMGPGAIGYVLGIAKAYTTRVGSGPFPTEQDNAVGERLGERGHEFGTVTGRKRRCGWFDAVLVRQAIKISGIDGIALTKLDVLDGFAEIKVCVGYTLDGERIDSLPAGQSAQARVEPIYESFEGWQTLDRRRAQLGRPAGAGGQVCPPHRGTDRVPGALLSTSPERDDTILMRDPFED